MGSTVRTGGSEPQDHGLKVGKMRRRQGGLAEVAEASCSGRPAGLRDASSRQRLRRTLPFGVDVVQALAEGVPKQLAERDIRAACRTDHRGARRPRLGVVKGRVQGLTGTGMDRFDGNVPVGTVA